MMKVWPCSSCGVDKWVLQIRGPPAFKIILPWQIALIWLTKDDVEYEESSEGRYQQSQLSNYNVASPTDSLIRIKLAYLHAFLPHQGYIVSEWCLPISMQSLNLVYMDGNPRQITWYSYVYCAPIMDCQNDKVLMTSFLEKGNKKVFFVCGNTCPWTNAICYKFAFRLWLFPILWSFI